MYDELISSLRICRRINSANDKCIAFHDGSCEAEPVCMYELMEKAADAIEALEIKAETFKSAYIAEHNARIDEIKRHMWIPVTERLPSAEKEVYVTDGEYIARAVLLDEVFPGDKPCWSYSGLGEITHWCKQIPLPEPPKEE